MNKLKLLLYYYWLKVTKTGPGKISEKEECKEWCGSGWCDDNGCSNRKRNLVNPDGIEVLYHAYGHTNKGDGLVVQVMAKNGREALDKARIDHPDCKFSHVNI